jgi:hypothetical protein
MFALTARNAAEVESQDNGAPSPQSARQPIDDLIVHGAAEQRMRVADKAGFVRRAVFRLFQKRFQLPGRTIEHVRLDAPPH